MAKAIRHGLLGIHELHLVAVLPLGRHHCCSALTRVSCRRAVLLLFSRADTKDLKLVSLGSHTVLACEQDLLISGVDGVGVASSIHHVGVDGMIPALLVTSQVSLGALLRPDEDIIPLRRFHAFVQDRIV